MLLVFTTFLLLIAGVSLAIFLKKLSGQNQLGENRPAHLAAESYRPLFAPTDEDLRSLEMEEKRLAAANLEAAERLEKEDKLAELDKVRQAWIAEPDRPSTIELLYRASRVGDGEAYLDTCDGVLAACRDGKLAAIPSSDLAQLLETHFWLLPAEQRTPGAGFRMKKAVAELKNGKV